MYKTPEELRTEVCWPTVQVVNGSPAINLHKSLVNPRGNVSHNGFFVSVTDEITDK